MHRLLPPNNTRENVDKTRTCQIWTDSFYFRNKAWSITGNLFVPSAILSIMFHWPQKIRQHLGKNDFPWTFRGYFPKTWSDSTITAAITILSDAVIFGRLRVSGNRPSEEEGARRANRNGSRDSPPIRAEADEAAIGRSEANRRGKWRRILTYRRQVWGPIKATTLLLPQPLCLQFKLFKAATDALGGVSAQTNGVHRTKSSACHSYPVFFRFAAGILLRTPPAASVGHCDPDGSVRWSRPPPAVTALLNRWLMAAAAARGVSSSPNASAAAGNAYRSTELALLWRAIK